MTRALFLRFLPSALLPALFIVPLGCDDGGADVTGPPDPPVAQLALQITPGARACEVMLTGPAEAQFDAAVAGRDLRQGDQIALAFAARADADFTADAVRLTSADAAALRVTASTCFDTAGAPLPSATVALIGR